MTTPTTPRFPLPYSSLPDDAITYGCFLIDIRLPSDDTVSMASSTKGPSAKQRMQPVSRAAARSPAAVAAQLVAGHDRAWLREVVSQLDATMQRSALERMIALWGVSSAEAAGFFGISRQAFAKWLRVGPPADRAPAVAALEDATELLARHLKRERIPAVVRRQSALTGERSLLQMAAAGEHERILGAVRTMFDLRRIQP